MATFNKETGRVEYGTGGKPAATYNPYGSDTVMPTKTTPTPTPAPTSYNFTQTPSQNANNGNNAGYSGSSGGGSADFAGVGIPTWNPSSSGGSSSPGTPAYNFTQTPQQNAKAGNDAGYSGNGVVSPTIPNIPKVTTPVDGKMTFEEWQALSDKFGGKQVIPKYDASNGVLQADEIKQLLALQKLGYQFDPSTNEALKVGQTQAMNRVKQDMAASGRLYSSFTDTQMQQAAQGLIPAYEEKARQDYQNKINNSLSMISALSGADATNYNRYRDTVSDNLAAVKTAYEKSQDLIKNDATYGGTYNGGLTPEAQTKMSTISKNNADVNETAKKNMLDAADKEATRTGWYINPQVKQSLSAAIPTQYIPVVQQYAGDFAAEINRRSKADPSDQLIPMLEAARYQKIMNDPALREKYMSDYYTQTLEGKKSATELQGKQLDNIIKQTEAEIALATSDAKAEKILLEVDKVRQDIQKGNVDIQEGLARIDDIRVQTGLRPIQTAIAQQNANSSSYSAETGRMNANRSQTKDGTDNRISDWSGYIKEVLDNSADGNVARGKITDVISEAVASKELSKEEADRLATKFALDYRDN